MIKEIAWNTFKKTGDINTYLEYKQYTQMSKKEPSPIGHTQMSKKEPSPIGQIGQSERDKEWPIQK